MSSGKRLPLPFGGEMVRSLRPFFETTGKRAYQMAWLSLWKANSSRKTLAERPHAASGLAGSAVTRTCPAAYRRGLP